MRLDPILKGPRRIFAAARARALESRASTGSLTRRMISIAALWIGVLLVGGGFALDRVLSEAITRNFDAQLEYVLNAMIASAEIGPDGEVRFNRPLGDQRFLEPYSGLYWQVSGHAHEPFRSRSLWDRALRQGDPHHGRTLHVADSDEFDGEPLRVLDREVRLPGSATEWRFQVAASRAGLNDQIAVLRRTLVRSFAILGLGLLILAALQATYGLWPLRTLRRAVSAVSSGISARIDAKFPNEVRPLVEELNELLAHNERQAEEARRHAGNLAHALKTPLTVLMNEATANSPELAETVVRTTMTMRRQVDHHLARARAVGRRANAQARSEIWPSLKAVERAMARMHRHVTVDLAGDQKAVAHVERQDLDEILGNLIENAAKYGQGRVFVTVSRVATDLPNGRKADWVELLIEDDGPGIPEAERGKLFERGARLDTGKPGTGLGLAIVRDVIGIYGGTIALEESEDLGGLQIRVRLPAAV
ncbi:sensor histidine kinase N-terminal domain-containing protein [Rhizorhabdus wittichii]|uniref:histidine kinase n=1 Tax=Rhizorhabdus wittichii TaxID=160791 RepID=A0A975D0T3_9SPHN|nr:sensor histidine kinase N-terminal domain-containing protein [Rhizorhabdus wittichii]